MCMCYLMLTLKSRIFWDVTPYSLVDDYQCFVGICYLRIQDLRVRQARNMYNSPCCSSELSVKIYQNTRPNNLGNWFLTIFKSCCKFSILRARWNLWRTVWIFLPHIESVLSCVGEETSISFFFVSWGGVRLSPLGTSATNWPIVPAPDDRW
jgi:hypothetical protein